MKIMKRLLFLFLMFCCFSYMSFAQTTISGTVTDSKGNALTGVNVRVKGSSTLVSTDEAGRYLIQVDQSASSLVFSFVGLKPVEEVIAGRNVINAVLNQSDDALEEVVVIGYGTVKKSDLTGSVASVKGADINAFPAANPLLTLSGRAAGVQVKQSNGHPGEEVSVRIRGTNSIMGDNEPLYIIDGIPSSPYVLNNSDIESIEILKDASATAIYGSRGANGVVIITTKQGKSGKTIVNYDYNFAQQSLRKKLALLNVREYTSIYNLRNTNSGLQPYFTEDMIEGYGHGTDWQDFAYRTSPMQTHSLAISGGDPKSLFSLSGSVFNQEGIIRNSGYDRYSFRAKFNHKLSKRVSVDLSSILSRISQANQRSAGGRLGTSLISSVLTAPPVIKPYQEDGSISIFSQIYPFSSDAMVNPASYIDETSAMNVSNQVSVNASLSYEMIDGLVLNIRGGVFNNDSRSDTYQTSAYTFEGFGAVATIQNVSFLNENTLTYSKVINDNHSFSALAGFTFQNFRYTNLTGNGRGFLSDVLETHYLGSARIPGVPQTTYTKSAIASYLGRINYNFNKRVLLTASIRSDGASKYSERNRWSYFPSAAIAWKIKEEQFLKNSKLISDLKLRASWGFTGSQAIEAYSTLNLLQVQRVAFGNSVYNGLSPSTSLPYNLRWETTEQKDIGLDVSLLQNRIKFNADWYVKNTTDLLNIVQLPSSTGFKTSTQNIGEMQNKGLEFSLDANVFDSKLQWDVSGNISFNRTKVIKLADGKDILGGYVNLNILIDNLVLLRENLPFGVFYGYLENGYDSDGSIIYKDLDGDGSLTSNDKVVLGNANPDYIYGFDSRLAYKNFELNMFFQGSQGNDIANVSKMTGTVEFGYMVNLLKDVYDNHWTPDNPDAKYPKIRVSSPTIWFSDRFIEDGSYLRLRNVEFAYNLRNPTNWIGNIRLFFSGQNLLTFTKYSWFDPEVNSWGGPNSIAQGIDHSTYPIAKTYTLGAQVKF